MTDEGLTETILVGQHVLNCGKVSLNLNCIVMMLYQMRSKKENSVWDIL